MLALDITDIRDFTEKLFLKETFDPFLLSEASFTTFAAFSINGRLQRSYYDSDEQKSIPEKKDKTEWKEFRPFCLSIIRGKRLPLHFQIVLQAPAEGFNRYPDTVFSTENSYYMNIQYKEKHLTITTGISLGSFFPGMKTSEQDWEAFVIRYLKEHHISFATLH